MQVLVTSQRHKNAGGRLAFSPGGRISALGKGEYCPALGQYT